MGRFDAAGSGLKVAAQGILRGAELRVGEREKAKDRSIRERERAEDRRFDRQKRFEEHRRDIELIEQRAQQPRRLLPRQQLEQNIIQSQGGVQAAQQALGAIQSGQTPTIFGGRLQTGTSGLPLESSGLSPGEIGAVRQATLGGAERNVTQAQGRLQGFQNQAKQLVQAGLLRPGSGTGGATPEAINDMFGKTLKIGDIVNRGGRRWIVVGFDTDGEPLLDPA